ncbi:hypothetical protein JCM11251_000632 [Rhodosporidiobolus azoricus]
MGWLPFSSFSSDRSVECFYCCSRLSLLPPAPTSSKNKGKQRAVEGDLPAAVGSRDGFWCSVCGQITRRDPNGDILADDPAQFDSSLNSDSFEKRASTSTTHLPPSFPTASTTPFCRQCLANQSLQLHLLASYPSSSHSDEDDFHPDDEDDPSAYPPLEEYRASLDIRYPLVCPSCLPSIESTIRERDYRVKAQALGWRLRESEKRREREEREMGRARRRVGRRRWLFERAMWRLRGVLWLATGLGTIGWCTCALIRPLAPFSPFPSTATSHPNLLLLITLLSLFWSFWDPTWDRLRTDRARGKVVHVQGEEMYVGLQGATYLLRVVAVVLSRIGMLCSTSGVRYFSSFLLAALLSAISLPRLSYPVPIRLAPSSTPTSSSTPLRSSTPTSHAFPLSTSSHPYPDPLEPLAHLSLSRKGSLLARPKPSPGQTPPGTPQGSRGKRKVSGGGLGGIRPRIPSFSLGSIPWGQDLAGGQIEQAMELDPSAFSTGLAAEEEAMEQDSPTSANGEADNSMDWTPLPPLSPPSSSAFRSAPSEPFSTSLTNGNHISFPRQRLIPPDLRKPTGLEGMFERVGLREEERKVVARGEDRQEKEKTGRKGWLSGLWTGK